MFLITANSTKMPSGKRGKKKIQIRFPKRSFWTENMREKKRRPGERKKVK